MAPFEETGDDGEQRTSRTSVEAGLMLMYEMMKSGRFKVFSHLNDWFAEFRMYHRKDGKIVKERDDLMSATRYGVMMRRYAICPPDPDDYEIKRDYDWRI